MRVGLHGWYWDGNLGDVLMAVMHARVLREAGHEVVVHRLPRLFADEFSLPTTENVDEFMRRADAVVYGGGGLFTGTHRDRTEIGPFADDSCAILASLRATRKPLFLCSVGGDGVDLGGWREWQAGFLQRADGISLRNSADAAWVSKHNRNTVFAHDVVWQTAAFFPNPPVAKNLGRVVVQWPPPARARRLFAGLSWLPERLGMLTRFHGAYFSWAIGGASRIVYSQGIGKDLGVLKGASAVASARLHMGMVALGYGVPYVPLLPTPKTRLMLQEIGWSGPMLDTKLQASRLFLNPLGAAKLGATLKPATLETLRTSADQHWKWLLASLAEHTSRS